MRTTNCNFKLGVGKLKIVKIIESVSNMYASYNQGNKEWSIARFSLNCKTNFSYFKIKLPLIYRQKEKSKKVLQKLP